MKIFIKLFQILILQSIIIFVVTCTKNSATLNISFIAILITWLVIQYKGSKTLPTFDSIFVKQVLCEIVMIVLSVKMLIT